MSAEEEVRETTGGVLGISAGLLLAAVLLMVLVFVRGGAIDAEERLRQLMGEGEPPFGLVVGHASKLPTGETVLRLVAPVERESGPAEVVFIEYPSPRAVAGLFRFEDDKASERLVEWEKDPTFEWSARLERDELTWGEWRTKYVRVRHFHQGGGWHESARVDLSQAKRNLVLFATWDDGATVEREVLVGLLKSVKMLP